MIASTLGTSKEHIKVNSHTKIAMNLMNIQVDMSIYSCKNDHRYRVNQVWEYFENWHEHWLIIVAVPFDGLKGKGVTATKR